MAGRAIFTIVSNNYLHYARTLMQSVAVHQPDCSRFCVVVDGDPTAARQHSSEFEAILVETLGLPDPELFTFRYSILEMNTAVKPWGFAALFERGFTEVVYLDPDIRVYHPLTEVFGLLGTNADVVLTPHLLAPMADDGHPNEMEIRRAGTYNLGFCALAARGEVPSFLDWWCSKLVDQCVVEPTEGIFVDQSWIDLVPGLFARVQVLRHPGYNVAYWNIAQRPLRSFEGRWEVLGVPLVFFHYSGFDANHPERFSKFQDRFTLGTVGPAQGLALDYAEQLIANGAREARRAPYAFATFDDGRTLIPDSFRRAWRKNPGLRAKLGIDPFSHREILTTLAPPRWAGHLSPTWAMRALWDARPDLQAVFPLTSDGSVAHFYDWFSREAPAGFSPETIAAHAAMHTSMMTMLESPDDRSANLSYPRGWYVAGADRVGIWAAPDAALPCTVDTAVRLTVTGNYVAEPVALQTGSPTTKLTILLGDRIAAVVTLEATGPFSIDAEVVPLPQAERGPVELRFACNAHFVPKAVGLNDDGRLLAWQATRIVLGDEVLLDVERSPPIAPLDKRAGWVVMSP